MARKKRPKIPPSRLKRARLEVFGRDNWTCQECELVFTPESDAEKSGQYAPGAFRFGKYVLLELAHIVPWQAGGLFIAANLRALCTHCNKAERRTTEASSHAEKIELAKLILNTRPPTEATATAAVNALLGLPS